MARAAAPASRPYQEATTASGDPAPFTASRFTTCYLEILTGMDAAMRLYERLGFRCVPGPRGDTGHHACDHFYALDLTLAG